MKFLISILVSLICLCYPLNLLCEQESELIIKEANSPICLTKLIVQGWGRGGSTLYDSILKRDVLICSLLNPHGQYVLERALDPFIGTPINSETIEDIKRAIYDYFSCACNPFVRVCISEQDISDGVLVLDVYCATISAVNVQCARWSSPTRLKRYLSRQEGGAIDLAVMKRDVSMMNRNEFRHVDVIYEPGCEIGTTDLTLIVTERRPCRLYVGTDNQGVDTTGRIRFFAGASYANVFGLDHFANVQVTVSEKFKRFQAYTFEYMAPIPTWHHTLLLYGGYSAVHPALPFPEMRNHGYSCQVSFRDAISLATRRLKTAQFIWGGDFKRTNNTVEFSELFPIISNNVNLTQLTLQYCATSEGRCRRFLFDIEGFYSPGQWLADQSNGDYNNLRPGAKNHWIYGRGSFRYLQQLPRCYSASVFLRGQYSFQSLLPSEQMGLGGAYTVRGYDERQLNTDNGVLVNFEVRSPIWPLFPGCKIPQDGLQFLVFADYGYGWNHVPVPVEGKKGSLLGVGPGIRYTMDPRLTARLDVGFRLLNRHIYMGPPTHVHFYFTYSY